MTGDDMTDEWQFALRIFSMSRPQIIQTLREALASNPLIGCDPIDSNEAAAEEDAAIDERCDVLLTVEEGQVVASANEVGLPLLFLDESRGQNLSKAERESLLDRARWLIRSVNQRSQAIVRVAQCIADREEAFFTEGPEHRRKLDHAQIAQAAEMQASTVRRLTDNRYACSSRGVFELASFFAELPA